MVITVSSMAHVLVQKLQKGILHAIHAQLRNFEAQMPQPHFEVTQRQIRTIGKWWFNGGLMVV